MSDWPQVPRFPDGFRWGAATAAYQIEGSLAADGRGASIWDDFPTTTGDTAATATDSYRRWREDIDLLDGLGANAYRFSVAWPRIQADGTGAPNPLGLDHYERFVDELCARGIDPAVTLYHWDLPQALEDAGGWLHRDTAERFAEYAGHVHARLGDRVKLWITHNEPFVHAAYGYTLGIHAPGKALLSGSFPAVHHLLLGHGLATAALRAQGATGIGITHNLAPVSPASDSPADQMAAARLDGWQNRVFCDPVLLGHYPDGLEDLFPGAAEVIRDGDLAVIGAPLDFLGVNYYNPHLVRASDASPLGFEFAEHEGVAHTSFGWPIVPAGLTDLLLQLRDRYDLPPVYITENGASFPDTLDDRDRVDYLAGHLTALRAAIDAGVDVRGYFCWSLLDNFEWAEGYAQRFGLVRVDFTTGERTPRDSYAFFRSLATR
ncbi:GH1 family beta-glucosidase [Longispora urticae]